MKPKPTHETLLDAITCGEKYAWQTLMAEGIGIGTDSRKKKRIIADIEKMKRAGAS